MMLRRDYTEPAERAARKHLNLSPICRKRICCSVRLPLFKSDLPEAVSQFKEERNLNPMDGAVYDRLGDAYSRSGDYAQCSKGSGSRRPSRTYPQHPIHSFWERSCWKRMMLSRRQLISSMPWRSMRRTPWPTRSWDEPIEFGTERRRGGGVKSSAALQQANP